MVFKMNSDSYSQKLVFLYILKCNKVFIVKNRTDITITQSCCMLNVQFLILVFFNVFLKLEYSL